MSFIGGVSFTVIIKGLKILVGILTSIVIARVWGAEGQGLYKLSLIIPSILISFGNIGLGPSSTYYLSKNSSNINTLISNIVYSAIGITILLLLAGVLLLSLDLTLLLKNVPKLYYILTLFTIPPIMFISIIGHINLGFQNVKLYNIANILSPSIFVITISIALLIELDFQYLMISYLTANYLAFFLAFYLSKKVFKVNSISYKHVNMKTIRVLLNFGFKTYLSRIVNSFHYHSDLWLINFFLNPIQAGLYSIANLINEKTWIISQSFSEILFPKVANLSAENDRTRFTVLVFKINLYISIIITIILFFLLPHIIVILYGDEFIKAIIVAQVLLIGTIFINCWRIIVNDLYGRGLLTFQLISSAVSTVINLLLNVLLIPIYGILGSAYATVLTYGLVFVLVLIYFIKKTKPPIIDLFIINKLEIGIIFTTARRILKLKK